MVGQGHVAVCEQLGIAGVIMLGMEVLELVVSQVRDLLRVATRVVDVREDVVMEPDMKLAGLTVLNTA